MLSRLPSSLSDPRFTEVAPEVQAVSKLEQGSEWTGWDLSLTLPDPSNRQQTALENTALGVKP